MKPATLIKRAVELLREDAQCGRESCMIGEREWTCRDCARDANGKCQARRSAEERERVAAGLEVLA